MAPPVRTVEQKIARIAAAAHGVATHGELLEAGISRDAIKHRLRVGALIRVYRGVYRVGHAAPSVEADYLAAVRACGDAALLAGRAAGHLLGLLKGPAPPPEVAARGEHRLRRVAVHRCRRTHPLDGAIFRGIPVTTVPRTVADLAEHLAADDLARAWHEAGVRFTTTPAHVEAVLARRPNARGARKLRRVLRGDVHVTLSTLERRFLALLREERLPLPETNRRVDGLYVDCRWPAHNLTVELDGYRYHSSRHAWEQDRRREREARKRGDDFTRYTYGDVVEEPGDMLAELRLLLRRRPTEAPG